MGMKLLETGRGFNRPVEGYSVIQAQTTISRVILSALIASGILLPYICEPALAQLPPVNMGKWVHQPGDNQYSNETQQSRHGAPVPVQQAAPVNIPLASPGWRPTPKPRRADISLLPIVCEEPVAPTGFPPMPEQLDLPGLKGGGMIRIAGGGGGGGSFSSTYGGSGGGSVSVGGMGAPAGGGKVSTSQGYTSVPPGAFVKRETPYGRGNTSSGPGDVFAGTAPSPQVSAAQNALKRMGKEPGLDDKGYQAAPEAPQAVQVNQSTSQDLSLPDDEMNSSSSNKKRSNSQGSRILQRTVGRVGNRMINSINAMPIPIRFPGGR